MCEYKIYIVSGSILIPIKMFKVLFPHTKITNLNRSIERKILLCTYNNWCIPQMEVWKVTIINKGIKFQYSFFVVLGNGPALLGIPDWETITTENKMQYHR